MTWTPRPEPTLPGSQASKSKAFAEAVRAEAAKGTIERGTLARLAKEIGVSITSTSAILKQHEVDYQFEGSLPRTNGNRTKRYNTKRKSERQGIKATFERLFPGESAYTDQMLGELAETLGSLSLVRLRSQLSSLGIYKSRAQGEPENDKPDPYKWVRGVITEGTLEQQIEAALNSFPV